MLALYRAQTRPGRRRAVVEDVVTRADEFDAEQALEALVRLDIKDVKKGTRERMKAERLFRRLFSGRAYQRVAAKRFDDARADFDAIVDETGSLEAVAGAIDMRLKTNQSPADIEAVYERADRTPSARPLLRRLTSWRRQLPDSSKAPRTPRRRRWPSRRSRPRGRT